MIGALLLATLMWPSPLEPKVGASCYGSSIALGTSNIPVSNGKATSVVNMWAALVSNQNEPVAWVYQNYRGEFWAQANVKMKSYVVQAFPTELASTLLGSDPIVGPPYKLKSEGQLKNGFARIGAVLHPCFLKALPSKYIGDVIQEPR